MNPLYYICRWSANIAVDYECNLENLNADMLVKVLDKVNDEFSEQISETINDAISEMIVDPNEEKAQCNLKRIKCKGEFKEKDDA